MLFDDICLDGVIAVSVNLFKNFLNIACYFFKLIVLYSGKIEKGMG